MDKITLQRIETFHPIEMIDEMSFKEARNTGEAT